MQTCEKKIEDGKRPVKSKIHFREVVGDCVLELGVTRPPPQALTMAPRLDCYLGKIVWPFTARLEDAFPCRWVSLPSSYVYIHTQPAVLYAGYQSKYHQ